MPLPSSLLLFASAAILHYQAQPGPWPAIFSSLGFVPGNGGIGVNSDGPVTIIQGASEIYGVRATGSKTLPVRNIVDVHSPKLQIVWEKSVDLPAYELPASATVFARERWNGMPVLAGWRQGSQAVLWLATGPGEKGHERFPYLAQALGDLGVSPPLRSRRLWAFFDASYRSRVDLDYFAKRWRESGIAALHVASWHFYDADPERDAYLEKLIEACHKNAILVYAWIELPHVSERFWNDHPEWREKTAIGQDAHLDWRRLMNLQNPECARAVSSGLERMVGRFDWDGLNLAELYFESLEGAANPARFTPMNADARRQAQESLGFDPQELFAGKADSARLRQFLDFRAGLAQRMQEHWMGEMDRMRKAKPDLHLVLTHVDDRYDARMRDLIGADAARLLPLLERRDFSFLIEDPATLWHLGPERYTEISARYRPITPRPEKLAIDINIVERYQDVYPTKQQTGAELFRLVHLAAGAFPRVALYFENSLLPVDLPWLGSAAASVAQIRVDGSKWTVESKNAVGIPWTQNARVDGAPWPYHDGKTLWLPPGSHTIEPDQSARAIRIVDFSGELNDLAVQKGSIELAYTAEARAWLVLDHAPSLLEVDGRQHPGAAAARISLPRGQHLIRIGN